MVLVEPTNFTGSTNVGDNVLIEQDIWDNMDEKTREYYGREYIKKFAAKMKTHVMNNPNKDRTPVVDAMVDAVTSANPKHRYLVGGQLSWWTYYTTYGYRILPSWFTDREALKEYDGLPLPAVLKEKHN